VCLVAVVRWTRPAVIITADAVTVIGPLATRRLPRPEVEEVGVSWYDGDGGDGCTVVLGLAGGRRLRVPRLWFWHPTRGRQATAAAGEAARGLARLLGVPRADLPRYPPVSVPRWWRRG
jgi:hypothetical protein